MLTDDPALWGLSGLLILLSSNFLVNLTLSALSNVRRQTLKERAEKGDQQAGKTLILVEHSARVLSTFRVANVINRFMIAGIIASLMLGGIQLRFSVAQPDLIIPVSVTAYLIVIPISAMLIYLFTGLLPQNIGQKASERWSIRLTLFARLTILLLRPLVAILHILQQIIIKGAGDQGQGEFTEERIKTMVDASEEEGAIEQVEKEMIYSIFELDETIAREIMVPRIDVVAIDIKSTLEESRQIILDAGHSRIPVYEESLDHIKGLLYAKDLLEVWHKGQEKINLDSMLREPVFVPESKQVMHLLQELKNKAVHLAIVIDEYGGTAGIVTIEDIIEEIVGEIADEYDKVEEAAFEQVGKDEYLVDARIDLDDFQRMLDVKLPDEKNDTLGGFIFTQLGKVPKQDEILDAYSLRFTILEIDDQRIGKVRIERIEIESDEIDEDETKEQHVSNGR